MSGYVAYDGYKTAHTLKYGKECEVVVSKVWNKGGKKQDWSIQFEYEGQLREGEADNFKEPGEVILVRKSEDNCKFVASDNSYQVAKDETLLRFFAFLMGLYLFFYFIWKFRQDT